MGSFRLAAGRRHLYRHCNFTGMFVETVSKSLHLSCGSELTRQGISLCDVNLIVADKHGLSLPIKTDGLSIWSLRILKTEKLFCDSFFLLSAQSCAYLFLSDVS